MKFYTKKSYSAEKSTPCEIKVSVTVEVRTRLITSTKDFLPTKSKPNQAHKR